MRPVHERGWFRPRIVRDLFHVRERALDNFRSGKGTEWGEHHPCLFQGTERFFRASYNANLLTSWLPALNGAIDRLNHGARVADVSCGHGASTILMAQSFPHSTFVGIDYHESSIETARKRAEDFISVVMRTTEVEIINTWDSLGMRGTDSNDIEAKGVFVPESRAFRFEPDSIPTAPSTGRCTGCRRWQRPSRSSPSVSCATS